MPAITIKYKPLPSLAPFHRDSHFFRLIGGSAFGGKSYGLFGEATMQCLRFKDLKGALVRTTIPSCEETFLPIARELQLMPHVCSYNKNKHIFHFHSTGSEIHLMFCSKDKDVEKFTQYDFMGIDELTMFNEWRFDFMTSRVRTSSSDPTFHPNVFAATNPGKIGHGWVKRRFITKNDPKFDYDPTRYIFFRSSASDNEIGMKRNPNYMKQFDSLPEATRRALVDGDWDIFEGQFFDIPLQVIPYFDISKAVTIIMGGDYGVTNPCAYYWGAIDANKNLTIFRELYETGMTAAQQGEMIENLSLEDPVKLQYHAFDPHHFSPEGRQKSIAEEIGGPIIPAERNRLARANMTRQFLQSGRLFVTKNCTNLIRTLPDLVHDENHLDDVDTDCEDHAYDAFSNLLCSPLARTMLQPFATENKPYIPLLPGVFQPEDEDIPLPEDELNERGKYEDVWW